MRPIVFMALGAGLLLGVATRLVYELPSDWWWLANVGGPWLAVAFGTGMTTRKPLYGALAGGVSLVTATLVYYGIMGLLQHAYANSPHGLAWLLVAAPAGLLFGALGTFARHPALRIPTVAALCAAFVAEAMLRVDHSTPSADALLLAALLFPLAAGRSHREQGLALAWAAALSVVAVTAGRVVLAVTGYS
jgi:uncharacterized protein DUF6518